MTKPTILCTWHILCITTAKDYEYNGACSAILDK